MIDPELICPRCRKPMKHGQPIHGVKKIHWDCQTPQELSKPSPREMEEEFKRLDEKITTTLAKIDQILDSK